MIGTVSDYLLCAYIDLWRFPDGILNDQEQLGDYLDDMTRLEDKVTLLDTNFTLEQAARTSFTSRLT